MKFRAHEPRVHESTTRLVDDRSGKRNKFACPLILVVDDSEDNRELCATLLERHGYEVVTASDGEDAVAKAIALRPHVILMDIGMPTMDGWEATRLIREATETASAHIIMLTAFADADSRRRSLAAGCDEFLAKPTPPDVLVARVGAAFERLRDAG